MLIVLEQTFVYKNFDFKHFERIWKVQFWLQNLEGAEF